MQVEHPADGVVGPPAAPPPLAVDLHLGQRPRLDRVVGVLDRHRHQVLLRPPVRDARSLRRFRRHRPAGLRGQGIGHVGGRRLRQGLHPAPPHVAVGAPAPAAAPGGASPPLRRAPGRRRGP